VEIDITYFFRYFIQWYDFERPFFENPNAQNLRKAMVYFGIRRIFQSGQEVEDKILKEMYRCNEVIELAKRLNTKDLRNKRIKIPSYVAASKLCWLIDQNHIIIDSQAIKALGLKQDVSYSDFTQEWKQRYQKQSELLQNIQNNFIPTLVNVQLSDDNKEYIHSENFIKRVFDNYLWMKGNN
jgi:hypothetical protein